VEIDHARVAINGKDAAMYYVSPTQLNVQAPTDVASAPAIGPMAKTSRRAST
jgi:uncharacterized protein (TIGR03437 family)